ncbi:hypothetical protein V6N11_009821 [Hibiscus sabdariffa]|uniref:Uncharacterized protein n=2 Tax=Hibiscus sabdariffa TaxID=183260 RepID=A0ABR2CC04_9ROSI
MNLRPPVLLNLKFNVSEVTKENKAGCGGILRIEEDTLRALCSGPIEGIGMNFAKLVAIKPVLELFLEANWYHVAGLTIEVDSQSSFELVERSCSKALEKVASFGNLTPRKKVLFWIENPTSCPWTWWETCWTDKLARIIGAISFCHVPRLSSGIADCITKAGLHRQEFFKA